MNEDDDDLEQDFAGGEDSFDEFTKVEKGTLAELWRENPAVRIGAIVLGAVLILAVIVLFGGKEKPLSQSRVSGVSDVSAPPGTEGASEAYVQAVEDENEARRELAEATGGSALPTPVDPPIGRVTLPPEDEEEEDPLQRWRRLQEERLERELKVRETIEPEPVVVDNSQAELVQALADGMLQQMQSILQQQHVIMPVYRPMTAPEYLEALRKKEEEAKEAAEKAAKEKAEEEAPEEGDIILQPAGEIVYAQLITEANSDTPGPVLAYIASGPLRGGRLIGKFDVAGELLVLSFEKVVYESKTYDASAVALDPETTLPGLATEVDHRYLTRVVFPTAAAFIEGLTTAIADSGRTSVTINGETVSEETTAPDKDEQVASGIAEAGEVIGEIFEEIADNTEILVKIDKGTPIGILFLESVVEEKEEEKASSTSAP